MKQTSIEFLEKELNQLLVLFSTKWEQVNTAIEQAKEMEKQQQGYSEEEVKQAIMNFYMNDMLLTPENLTKAINGLNNLKTNKI
jgi:hypothetical protein